MTVDYLQGLFDYNFAMNDLILKSIQEFKSIPDKTLTLFAHLLSAEKIWMMRLNREDLSKQIIWPDLSQSECSALIENNKKIYSNYLAQKNDHSLNTNIVYTTSKGEIFETPIVDILIHVIIHSGYHRGQINALIRKAGGEPINTDYIHYVRYLI